MNSQNNDFEKIKNILFKNHSKVISFGSSCFTKRFLDLMKISQETHFFDYLGTKAWSICDLFENDFQNLFQRNDFENTHILTKGDQYTITNKKYYINFKHDFHQTFKKETHMIQPLQFRDVSLKYERRINRLKDLLKNNENKLLFIRIEQRSDRVLHPSHSEKDELGELYFCKKFMKILKEKYPSTKMTLLFLYSHIEKDTYFQDENIIVLKLNNPIENYDTCHFDTFLFLLSKYDFLKNIL